MRALQAVALATALAAMLAAPVQAFPITSQDYSATAPFAAGVEGIGATTYLSGRMETGVHGVGPHVLLNVTGFAVHGLTKVCWTGSSPGCAEGALTLEARDGGTVALQFPQPVAANLTTEHSIAFFLDLGEPLDFAGYAVEVDRSLAGVHVGGRMAFGAIAPLPRTDTLTLEASNAAGLVVLDATTRLQLTGDGAPRTLSGDLLALTFQGAPAIAPFGVGASLTPFPVGTVATLAPADPAAAEQGVDLERVTRMARDLESAFGGAEPSAATAADPDQARLRGLLGAILAGALLTPPVNATSLEESVGNLTDLLRGSTFLRFDALTATATADGVLLAGSGPLQIVGGRVVGAPGLLGIMPWWCWVLWLSALGLWVARLVLKPAKESEAWDRLRWVGWVAAPVVSLLVFWLWDGQVHEVWGVSLLRGGGPSAMMFLLLTEVLIGLMVYVAVVVPLSSLLKSGSRFAKQGRFMGLHRPVALLLGFLLGTTLLLSYVDFMIGLVG